METFGSVIRSLRRKQGLFLRQVAAAVDVDTSMISKFEKGERFPNREQLERLACLFNVPAKDLLISALGEKLGSELENEPLAKEILERAIQLLTQEKINGK